jgi:histidine triad (HIT) family protein
VAYRDDFVVVFPARHVPVGHEGAVLLATTAHIASLYDVDDTLAATLLCRVRDTAIAVQRTFGATGTTIRQNNGSPGQDVAHVHFHIAPRFTGDDYRHAAVRTLPDDERDALAARLRADAAPITRSEDLDAT